MIFLLDDNKDDLDIIVRHLKNNGIENCKGFTSDDLFLSSLKDRVNIVIIDHSVNSKRTGLDVMKEINKKIPLCYPIIVSGNDSPRIIMQYFNNDAFRYVLKNDSGYLDLIVKYIRQAQDRMSKILNYMSSG